MDDLVPEYLSEVAKLREKVLKAPVKKRGTQPLNGAGTVTF